MKHLLMSALIALASLSVGIDSVEAKRLGGGSTSGLKRQAPPPQQTTPPTTAQPAPTPGATAPGAAAAPAAAAAATPKRSWMGPIAGLAAGLGIAALMSHLGLGGAMANFLTIALLLVAGFFLVRFLMRRFGPAARGPSLATPQGMRFDAGRAPDAPAFGGAAGVAPSRDMAVPAVSRTPAATLPAGFDTAAFERIAKLIFIRMQAANDAGNLDDLRQFSTPEMFAVFRLELQDRQGAAQKTDVVKLDAEVVDHAEDAGQYIVSVRFHGLVREESEQAAQPFDEVWHLVKPADGSREWAIAGIQQHGA